MEIEVKKERQKTENKAKQMDRKIEILKVRIIERLKEKKERKKF